MSYSRFKPWFSKPCPPKFNGNIFNYPAVEFIQDFEDYIESVQFNYRVNQWTKRSVFLACLENDAKIWAKVFGNKYRTYEDVKLAFLRRFWGDDVQRHVMEEFLYGTYRQKGQWSKMALYFIGMLRRISFVIPSLPDLSFLDTIGYHYPHHIQQQLMKQQSNEDAYLYLLEVDRSLNKATQIYKTRKQMQQLSHSARSFLSECCVDTDYKYHEASTNISNEGIRHDSADRETITTVGPDSDDVLYITATTPESLGSSSGGRCNEAAEGHNNNGLLEVKGSEINTTTDEDQPTPGLVYVGRVKTRQSKPRAKKKVHGKRGKR